MMKNMQQIPTTSILSQFIVYTGLIRHAAFDIAAGQFITKFITK